MVSLLVTMASVFAAQNAESTNSKRVVFQLSKLRRLPGGAGRRTEGRLRDRDVLGREPSQKDGA